MFENVKSILGKLHHNHTDVVDMGYTYCSECGSPFSSVYEAKKIMESKRKTHRLNELMGKQKPRKGVVIGMRRDGTCANSVKIRPGLTDVEQLELEMLTIEHFDGRPNK